LSGFSLNLGKPMKRTDAIPEVLKAFKISDVSVPGIFHIPVVHGGELSRFNPIVKMPRSR
jgi:hypothetical protein